MGTVMLSIALCVLLPLALLSVYLNRKGRRMMISLGVGIVACLVAYFINSALLRLKFIGDMAGSEIHLTNITIYRHSANHSDGIRYTRQITNSFISAENNYKMFKTDIELKNANYGEVTGTTTLMIHKYES